MLTADTRTAAPWTAVPEIVALHEQLVAPGTGPARGSVLPRDKSAWPLTAAQRLSVKTI